jgi:nucleotide-binding universal stress UspA family protein
MSSKQYSPLGQLVLSRLREFFRQPEVVFWVYGFPILMVVALGIAFRNKPVEHVRVGVQQGEAGQAAGNALSPNPKFQVRNCDPEECRLLLRTGKIDLIVIGTHGRTGVSRFLMGSVAEHVVRTAPCPVLVVRPSAHEFVVPDPVAVCARA